ncbi:hypothetical protein D1872_331000 [compost metagenome]
MDPLGNSALIGEKVKSRLLTEEEIRSLSLGPYVLVPEVEGENSSEEKGTVENSGEN